MAKISLRSKDGKKLAVVDTNDAVVVRAQEMIGDAIKVHIEEMLNMLNGKRKQYTGYIRREEFNALNVSTVAIPQTFAGLEAVMVPTRLKEQFFEIKDVVENEDYVEIVATHIFYRQIKNNTLWEPTKGTKYTAAAVCRNVMTNAVFDSGFNVASDCTDELQGSELDYTRKNIVEAFLNPESGICAKFGLSLIRDNWDFYCLKNVGYDRGFVIQNGKNLLGVERKESIENVATRIAPFGKNKDGNVVWLNNNGLKYIDSPNIGDYAVPMLELYDTGLQVGKDDVTDANINDKILQAAQKRFSEDKVDIPEVEMTINFLSLGDTEEYAQYRDLDKVYLYDIVTIRDTVRGYDYSAQVVGAEHDILTGMLISVTLGKIQNSDGTRKIATWQVPEVSGENIRLKSIMAGSFAPEAIRADDIGQNVIGYAHFASAAIDQLTADSIEAVTANIQEIIAGKVTADSIVAGSIETQHLAANAITAEKIDSDAIKTRHLDATAITAEKIASDTIKTRHLDANSITAEKIASDAIKTRHLDANAITADKIQSNTIVSRHIDSDTIQSRHIVAREIDASKIAAGTITAYEIHSGAITADKIDTNAVTAEKIQAGSIDADKISANAIDAINAKLGIANIANAQIASADIGYAQIKDLTAGTAIIETSITEQGIADKLYINRLMITYGQMVEATIGDLVIGASDGYYYHVDVEWDEYGEPTLVPSRVQTPSAAEIEAGHTAGGQTIIGNVGTFAELSSENFYAINSIIDRITAKRIDVDQLWAREAFVNKLMVQDISSNTYIQSTIGDWQSGSTITQTINGINSRITQLGYGTFFYSTTPPDPSGVTVGDVWIEPIENNTWDDVAQYTWDELSGMTWEQVAGQYRMYVWTGSEWKLLFDNMIVSELQTQINQNAWAIQLKADQTAVDTLSGEVTDFSAVLEVQAREISAAVSAVNAKTANYIQLTDPADDPEIVLHLGDTWTKTTGGTWDDLSEFTWDQLSAFTWDQLGGSQVYTWSGTGWIQTADTGAQLNLQTRFDQTERQLLLMAEEVLTIGDSVYKNSASIKIQADRIDQEVERASRAESEKISKTAQYQTADEIVSAAQRYTDGFLEDESRIEQTATGITAYVASYTGEHAYQKYSGIEIKSAGIEISGHTYIKIKSGGSFSVDSQKFVINEDGSVSVNGSITATTITANTQGNIAGWTISQNKLSSGSGTGYVALDSTSGGTYAIWAGAESAASAKFYVKRDGSAKFDGTVTAGAGSTIGGWSVGANRLSSGSGAAYVAMDSTANGTYAIWAGAESAANAAFYVKRDGSAKFSGTVSAGAGSEIGGWSVGANRLSSGSGAAYVAMDSTPNGTYAIWAGAENAANAAFYVKRNGAAKFSGEISAAAGSVIGGWNIGTSDMYSGSGTSRVGIASSGSYAFYAGAENPAAAPFRLKHNGTLTITSLNVVNEQGQETPIDLRVYPLWKLYYHSIKSYTANSITLTNGETVNFNTAAAVRLSGRWTDNWTRYTVTARDGNGNIIGTQSSGAVTADMTNAQIKTALEAANDHKTILSIVADGEDVVVRTIDASGVYTQGWNASAAAVTLSGGWTDNWTRYTVTAKDGNGNVIGTKKSGVVAADKTDAQIKTALEAANDHKTILSITADGEDIVIRTIDASGVYSQGWSASAAAVTLTGGWTDGWTRYTVTAKDGNGNIIGTRSSGAVTADKTDAQIKGAIEAASDHKTVLSVTADGEDIVVRTIDASGVWANAWAASRNAMGKWNGGAGSTLYYFNQSTLRYEVAVGSGVHWYYE